MKQSFTKIYDKEEELLFQTNSINAYRVYIHLKKDNSYFKKEFMDLRRCIADYLNMPERTVKDAIKRLIKVGLIQTKKKGKVNYYILPYDSQNKPIITYKEDERKPDIQTEQPIITPTYEDVEKSIEEATVLEVKTPSVPIKEEKKEEQDTTENNEQIIEDDMEKKDLSWLDSDEFYAMRISKNIEYWMMLNRTKQTDKLNEHINEWVKYDSNRFFEGEYKDEIRNKIWSYINNRIAS